MGINLYRRFFCDLFYTDVERVRTGTVVIIVQCIIQTGVEVIAERELHLSKHARQQLIIHEK